MAYVYLIADYGDPGAFAEVEYALEAALGTTAKIRRQEVQPLSTINAGFWVQQHGLVVNVIHDTILVVNVAPRAVDLSRPLDPLVYGRLENGVHVLAINSGHTLSWVRHRFAASQLYEVVYDHAGSQFRSRDAFPAIVRALLTGELFSNENKHPCLSRMPQDPRQSDVVLQPPAGVVVLHVDGYGNCKLSVRESQIRSWRAGSRVIVVAGDRNFLCEFRRCDPSSDGAFQGPPGSWVIGPGSSGHEDRFLEIWRLRATDDGGGAAVNLGGLKPGSTIVLEPLAP